MTPPETSDGEASVSNEELAKGDASGQENPATDERLRVMIVDDHEVWRIGLRQALEADGRAVVVAEAKDGALAMAMAAETMPDVVVMDMIMPTVGGAAATRRIIEQLTYAKVLVVSVSGEREDVLDAIKAGASGYVLKSEPAQSIADAVHATSRGEPVITAALAGLVLNEFRALAGKDPTEPLLTKTESEILRLVAHVQNILGKLHMHTKYELIAYAIRHGLDRAADQPAPQVSPNKD